MLCNIGGIPETSYLTKSELFKNMPVPSGSTLKNDTQTYDYDKPYKSTLNSDLNEKEKLLDKLDKFINMLPEEIIILSENSAYSKPYDKNISPGILQICDIWGIRDYLFIAIDLIKKHFSSLQDISIALEKDQEVDEEWLVLDVTIAGEIDEILDEYDKYSENLVDSVKWPERDKIRLSYNIV